MESIDHLRLIDEINLTKDTDVLESNMKTVTNLVTESLKSAVDSTLSEQYFIDNLNLSRMNEDNKIKLTLSYETLFKGVIWLRGLTENGITEIKDIYYTFLKHEEHLYSKDEKLNYTLVYSGKEIKQSFDEIHEELQEYIEKRVNAMLQYLPFMYVCNCEIHKYYYNMFFIGRESPKPRLDVSFTIEFEYVKDKITPSQHNRIGETRESVTFAEFRECIHKRRNKSYQEDCGGIGIGAIFLPLLCGALGCFLIVQVMSWGLNRCNKEIDKVASEIQQRVDADKKGSVK